MRELAEHETRNHSIFPPMRLSGPMKRQPTNKLALRDLTTTAFLDGLEIVFRGFVTKPFVPMAANSLEWRAQKSPGPEALFAPVPKSPEPDELHGASGGHWAGIQLTCLSERRSRRKGIRSVTFNCSHWCARSAGNSVSIRYSASTDRVAGADSNGWPDGSATNVV